MAQRQQRMFEARSSKEMVLVVVVVEGVVVETGSGTKVVDSKLVQTC